ncbi:hypothetical protein KPSA1_02470 [Pseudomonas syringae pv. actinidiae]|uniref:Uncharacterized protein n=1 Tax=Pseudomonas syringae pv. actinidiae TaxID=103796 RepID=A0A2V0Q887_PSESF|nr:hypothetical protein KPSA1_02470 [Pseudomonas syringae pv. actinidiae]
MNSHSFQDKNLNALSQNEIASDAELNYLLHADLRSYGLYRK